MKFNLIKRIFKYKKNYFIFALSFLTIFVSAAYTNFSGLKIKTDEQIINDFPDYLSIERINNSKDIANFLANNYDDANHFELFEITNQETIFNTNLNFTEKTNVNIYGSDNNFLNLKLINDANLYYEFDKFSLCGENNYSDYEIKNCECVCYLPKNYRYLLSEPEYIEINNLNFKIKGFFEFKNADTLKDVFPIFIPSTTFLKLFPLKTNKVTTIIFSEINNRTLNSQNNLKKSKIIDLFESKHGSSNNSLIFSVTLLLISEISLCVICIFYIKNRTNEIGIKLAVGAKKIDIVAEVTVEMLVISLIGSLLGVVSCSLFSLFLEAIVTCFTQTNYFYINVPFSLFGVCIFSIGAIVFSIFASILSVNTNIESMLKEER